MPTRLEKRVLRRSSARARRSERNKNTSRRKTTSKSTRLHFQKQEKALKKAKTKKKALTAEKHKTKDSSTSTKLDERNTSESCSQRPVRVATKKALESIGKVSRYESQTDNIIGSLASLSDNEKDDDFNLDDFNSSRCSTPIPPSSPPVPTLPSPPKYYYHPTSHNKRKSEVSKSVQEKDEVRTSNTNVSIHSYPTTEDESNNSDLLPLTILKQRLQRTNKSTVPHKTTMKINTMADIYRSFDLPKSTNTNIPSISDRTERSQLNISNPRKWNGLVNVSLKCISTLLQIICPGPSRSELVQTIANRLNRTVMNNVVQKKHSDEMILDENDQIEIDNTLHGERNEKRIDYETVVNKIIYNMFTMLKASKNASIEKRVIRAIVARSLKTSMVKKNCAKYGVPDLSIGKVTRQIKQDFDKLMNGEQIKKKEQTRAKISDGVIDDVVSYILHKDHIFTMSWGDRSYKLSDSEDTIVLPCLCRKQSPLHLWRTYQSRNNNGIKVGRSTFYNIVRDLTVPTRNIATCIDYVQALLVSEPIELLQEIVEKFVPIPSQDIYRDYLTSVSTFLKNTYQKHAVISEDNCVAHDLKYILGRVSNYDDSVKTHSKSEITCTQCKFPFFVCSKIKEEITNGENSNGTMNNDEFDNMKADAIRVVNDCVEKIKLYMGHKARCTNQNKAIEKIHERMAKKCADSNGKDVIAMVIADYKMKFEPISARETTIDHFGKRGISWHGFCVQFYLWEEKEDESGDVSFAPTLYTIYIDQILSDGNKQDSLSVISLLDAALAQISQELPFINSIVLQSDNAKAYNNVFMLCAIPLINAKYSSKDISIVEFIHTETQDGKTILDAHYARCNQHLRHFLTEIKTNKVVKINTPLSLAIALSRHGGMKNVAIQIVRTDYIRSRSIEMQFEEVTKDFKLYFSRINHAYFYPLETTHCGINNLTPLNEIINSLKFTVGVQAFSNINRVVKFHIDMKLENRHKLKPDSTLVDEFGSKTTNIADRTRRHSSAMLESLQESELLRDAVAALMDLDPAQKKKDDESVGDDSSQSEEEEEEYDTDDSSVKSDHSYCSDDSSKSDSSVESDDDLDEEFYNVERLLHKRELIVPDQEIYDKDLFITKVDIEMLLPFGNIRSSRSTPKNKSQCRIVSTSIIRQDVRSRAIRVANNSIQQGNIRITSAYVDDPLLQDSASFLCSDKSFHWEQG